MTYTTMRLPISVKGIVFQDGKVWLRRNERSEWELPGGKLEPDEQPGVTVEREMAEELGMRVRPVAPVHAHRHTIPGSVDESAGVLVLSYLCEVISATGRFELDGEGGAARFDRFALDDLGGLVMPDFYREAIIAGHATAEARGRAPAAGEKAVGESAVGESAVGQGAVGQGAVGEGTAVSPA